MPVNSVVYTNIVYLLLMMMLYYNYSTQFISMYEY